MKIYILTGRRGTDLIGPNVFTKLKHASMAQEEIMYNAMLDSYSDSHDWELGERNPTLEELLKWAECQGFGDIDYFWDGHRDATECVITGFDIEEEGK